MKVFVLTMTVLLLMGATRIEASKDTSADTTTAQLSRQFSTVDEAAKAIWAAEGKSGDCTTYVLGPISGEGCYYRVYFLSPDQQSFYGTATIIAEGKYFHIPTLGGYFFHRSGKAEGTFDPRLFDKAKVRKYLADRYPEIGPVQKIWLMHPGVSRFEWLWEVATPSQTYYLHVADTKGTARLVTKAELDQARAADTVKVDSVITNGGK
jgi:hypothetical protein